MNYKDTILKTEMDKKWLDYWECILQRPLLCPSAPSVGCSQLPPTTAIRQSPFWLSDYPSLHSEFQASQSNKTNPDSKMKKKKKKTRGGEEKIVEERE